MTEIKNIETLHAEISRLRSEIRSSEQRMREEVLSFRESLKPANLLSAGFKNMLSIPDARHENHFMREVLKTGLILVIGKVLFNPGERGEKRVSDVVDIAFDKVRSFIDRRRKKKKDNPFYKFEDNYDSESN